MKPDDSLSTYPLCPQRKKKKQKERKDDYSFSFNLKYPEGPIHLLIKGDILTCYEQELRIFVVS